MRKKGQDRCCYAPTDIGDSFLSSALEFGGVWMKGVYEAGFKLIKNSSAVYLTEQRTL